MLTWTEHMDSENDEDSETHLSFPRPRSAILRILALALSLLLSPICKLTQQWLCGGWRKKERERKRSGKKTSVSWCVEWEERAGLLKVIVSRLMERWWPQQWWSSGVWTKRKCYTSGIHTTPKSLQSGDGKASPLLKFDSHRVSFLFSRIHSSPCCPPPFSLLRCSDSTFGMCSIQTSNIKTNSLAHLQSPELDSVEKISTVITIVNNLNIIIVPCSDGQQWYLQNESVVCFLYLC